MSFEAEVIPIFISGVSTTLLIELITGCVLLKQKKKARNFLIGHVISMAAAVLFLIRCIFAKQLSINTIPAILSNTNSINIGLFGVFWTVSVLFILAVIASCMKENTEK
ncbi:MAG: hypothetical protein IJ325_12655 [Clostridia bacterium]|nr:hypothetical protein [Clostridia bacterium]